MADPAHLGLPDYHGGLAGALATVGRFSEALTQRQLAISAQLSMDNDEPTAGVAIARYFLADLYVQLDDPSSAIRAVEPSLEEGAAQEWLLRVVTAQSFHALGQHEEAFREAEIAVMTAPCEAKGNELLETLAPILSSRSTG
ncbi:MAG: hypothetical protein ACMG6H_04390 [Acidobacteriota bacterium]